MELTPEQQRDEAYAEIRVKLIENGVLVKYGPRWYSYASWAKASESIAARLLSLQAKRAKESINNGV